MRKPIEKLEDLDAWQVSIDLAVAIHDLSTLLPTDERFGLIFQIRKASVSIASNIAEGYGRMSTGDYIYHLKIANGENREVFTQLIIIQRKRYIDPRHPLMTEALQLVDRVGRLLTALRRSLGDS